MKNKIYTIQNKKSGATSKVNAEQLEMIRSNGKMKLFKIVDEQDADDVRTPVKKPDTISSFEPKIENK